MLILGHFIHMTLGRVALYQINTFVIVSPAMYIHLTPGRERWHRHNIPVMQSYSTQYASITGGTSLTIPRSSLPHFLENDIPKEGPPLEAMDGAKHHALSDVVLEGRPRIDAANLLGSHSKFQEGSGRRIGLEWMRLWADWEESW